MRNLPELDEHFRPDAPIFGMQDSKLEAGPKSQVWDDVSSQTATAEDAERFNQTAREIDLTASHTSGDRLQSSAHDIGHLATY